MLVEITNMLLEKTGMTGVGEWEMGRGGKW
jgi:hypothetical protein